MKLLAIETSSTACSVALLIHGDMKELHHEAPQQQTQLVLPMIDQLLRDAQLSLTQLDALSFGCGPGSFTGLRIAASVIQGLGFAAKLPIIPVSSLAALAEEAYRMEGHQKILTAMDARIQEVYWASYEMDEVPILLGDEKLTPPGQCCLSNDADWVGVGNAWEVYASMPKIKVLKHINVPRASSIARLAAVKFEKNEWVKPEDALPVYLRNEVASTSSNNVQNTS